MPMATAKRGGFHLVARGGVEWLECGALSGIPWLRHAFSTRILHQNSRQSGVEHRKLQSKDCSTFDCRLLDPFEAAGSSPYQLFLDRLGVDTLALASLRQIHSSVVYRVSSDESGALRYTPSGYAPGDAVGAADLSGDALLTDQPGILLSVRIADCAPILLVDPAPHAIAVVHAGWRGLLQRIAEKTVGEMRRTFHSQPEELLAAVGPSIRVCCYEVGPEVVEGFRSQFTQCESYFREMRASEAPQSPALPYSPVLLSARPPGRGPAGPAAAHLDLVAIARDQLHNAGLRSANIHVADFCTACRTDLFFSHRKEGKTGRMIAVIGMI